MNKAHQLILTHGVDAARAAAQTKGDRMAVNAAAAVMSEEEGRMGITHAGFAMTSLPHKRIEEPLWRRDSPQTTLLVEAGRDRQGKFIGVPYGGIARLILLYLQTEAIRTGSSEVELGRSMKGWMSKMGLTTGGRTYQLVAEQALRISSSRLTFFTERPNGAEIRQNGAFVQDAISLAGVMDDGQPSLWQDRVRLDEGFYRSLKEHPVPVREEAIRAIGTKSLALDVYVWLSYRLHSLSKPTPISWTALHTQFGAGIKAVRHFKPVFMDALQLATAVYPEAGVNILEERGGGIMLRPSAPAVSKIGHHRSIG
jgi:hypothetical protein